MQEAAQNAQAAHSATGQKVNIGDVIQLRHSRSGNFVSLSERVLALAEPGCVRVELDDGGSTSCWLRVGSGLAPHVAAMALAAGAAASVGEQLTLSSSLSGKMLHCSSHELEEPHHTLLMARGTGGTIRREVNGDDGGSSWTVHRYRQGDASDAPHHQLATGSFVSIVSTNSKRNLHATLAALQDPSSGFGTFSGYGDGPLPLPFYPTPSSPIPSSPSPPHQILSYPFLSQATPSLPLPSLPHPFHFLWLR